MNSLTLYFKALGKKKETKSKVSRRKEIIITGAEINEIENRKTV